MAKSRPLIISGWTVIQRQIAGVVSFNRIWTKYKQGFGHLSGNFWLGNENIHRLLHCLLTLKVKLAIFISTRLKISRSGANTESQTGDYLSAEDLGYPEESTNLHQGLIHTYHFSTWMRITNKEKRSWSNAWKQYTWSNCNVLIQPSCSIRSHLLVLLLFWLSSLSPRLLY